MKAKTATSTDTATEEVSYDTVLVPLAHLLAHPELKNRPIDKDHVSELFDSIERNGLDTPLNSWNGGADDSEMEVQGKNVPANFLIAGFHRREALRRLLKEKPDRFNELFPEGNVPVRRRGGSLVDMIALQIRENANRKDPALAEIVPLLQKLRDTHKLKSVAIAKKIGKSEAWVSRVISFLDNAGEDAIAAAQDNKLSFREAMKLGEESKKAAKAGKPLSKEEKAAKTTKAVAKTASSKKGDKKRVSVKGLYSRYKALKSVPSGRKLTILEEAFAYAAGESDDLPEELKKDASATKTEKKPAKVAKSDE